MDRLAELFELERHLPLDSAVWLLEYVSRTKGADHLKIESRNLNLLQYFCIDTITFIILSLFVVGFIVYKTAAKCFPWLIQANAATLSKIIFIVSLSTLAVSKFLL